MYDCGEKIDEAFGLWALCITAPISNKVLPNKVFEAMNTSRRRSGELQLASLRSLFVSKGESNAIR